MNNLIRMSAFNSRLDVLLQGIDIADFSIPDRYVAIRQAVREFSKDYPNKEVLEFAGSDNSYYLLFGLAEDVDEANRDAGIDLTSSGAGVKLGIRFTLDYRMEIHQVAFWLSRTGATLEGMLSAALYTVSANLPDRLIATSIEIDIDEVEGAPQGRFTRVRFPFAAGNVFELDAGTYYAVLQSNGYTYANGTAEVILGVDQSSPVANTVATHNGTIWSAYGTPSAGILEVMASVPGWRKRGCAIESVEYPAAEIASDEEPQMLEDEDYRLFQTQAGIWLYLPSHSPSSTEKVRLTYSRPYMWVESDDPLLDLDEVYFEALSYLAAAVACQVLAVRYGQNTGSVMAADVVDRKTQADQYQGFANKFRAQYKALVSQDDKASLPGQTITDVDYAYEVGSDFLFHRRSRR